jgi:ATP-dependent DNA ligase
MLVPPVPPMLASAVDRLPVGSYAYEPKWDGWRVLVFRTADGVFLQSRTGKPLAGYFPEITRLARRHLPPGLVLDGELVIWEAGRERTSFTLLQRRVAGSGGTTGGPVREAYRNPAHLVAFDALQVDGAELLAAPLTQRRAALVAALADAPAQLAVCPQTTEADLAREWLDAWTRQGLEGLVIKPLAGPYQPGRRGWRKLRRRHTTEAIIAGVAGQSLLLARFDAAGRLRYAGRSTPLTPAQRAAVEPVLVAPGPHRDGGINHPWPRPLPAGWSGHFDAAGPLDYRQVVPDAVAEVRVDSAYEHSRWRHPVRFVRLRVDLAVHDVPLLEP